MKQKKGSLPVLEIPRYEKKQILASAQYRACRDLAQALLQDCVNYTLEEVEQIMKDYRKGKVK